MGEAQLGAHMDNSANPEKVCKQLFSEEEDSGHVKCRYKILGRLILSKYYGNPFILIL